MHFPANVLTRARLFDVCSFATVRPLFCHDLWQNFDRSSNTGWYSVGHIAKDIRSKYHELQDQYPGQIVDVTILSNREDIMLNRGGLTQGGCPKFDVSTIISTTDGCVTTFVQDYRYEGDLCASNVIDWFSFVGFLRWTGQIYFIVRIVLLLVVAVVARAQEEAYKSASSLAILRAGLRTVARVPAQGIVYGSPLPVLLYVIAYLIDTPMLYAFISERFCEINGKVGEFGGSELLWILATQMRNVWVLGLTLQIIVSLLSGRGGTPPQGIIGMPEFSLSLVSALTVLGQIQIHIFRDTRIVRLFEVGSSPNRIAAIRAFGSPELVGSVIMEGAYLDIKILIVLFGVAIAVMILMWALVFLSTNDWGHRLRNVTPRTCVPYSAGKLWPVAAFSINWEADFFPVTEAPTKRKSRLLNQFIGEKLGSKYLREIDQSRSQSVVLMKAAWPRNSKKRFEVAFLELENLHSRSDDGHGVVAMMNLFAIPDPLALLRLLCLGDQLVCYLRDCETGEFCCLPFTTFLDQMDCAIPWYRMELVKVVRTSDMTWSELLHCG
ncbi:TPA: hypothetical protein N0F65_009462 [Lagenidium giganteum]|uniref:Uncharacterized protein n=1 Tax=Lagenidium giganteum TaxID=4803 RepID=A0AAV2ZGM7_9STRA|nr:TPA: hypothetical protein N0F65_009462 [Lagenidium giganteum]